MSAFALAILAMAFKDAAGTLLVIAEARGRAMLAGLLDAIGDLAQILVMLAGAGAVIEHGWTVRTMFLLLAMMLTSAGGTVLWTKLGQHIAPAPTPSRPQS